MRISAFDTFSQLSISNREENLQIQKEKDKISPSLSFFFLVKSQLRIEVPMQAM